MHCQYSQSGAWVLGVSEGVLRPFSIRSVGMGCFTGGSLPISQSGACVWGVSEGVIYHFLDCVKNLNKELVRSMF